MTRVQSPSLDHTVQDAGWNTENIEPRQLNEAEVQVQEEVAIKAPSSSTPRRSARERITLDMPVEKASTLREQLKADQNHAWQQRDDCLGGLLAAIVAGEEFPNLVPQTIEAAFRSHQGVQWHTAALNEL